MNKLMVNLSLVNTDKNCIFHEGQEPTDCTTTGEIYRRSRDEYGRCVSKMYVDSKTKGTKQVGWVFQKRMEYDDGCPRYNDNGRRLPPETYLQEAWVEVVNVHITNPFEEEEEQ